MNPQEPKITIITPSYNQGKYIEQTIRSVLKQNYSNLEYIIIDGGSTDETTDILRKYDKKIHYWVSEKDLGQSDAINKGLKMASGDIINWLNSDDHYEPGALQAVAKAFLYYPPAKVVCGRSRRFKDQNTITGTSKGTDIYPGNLAKTIGWARIDQPETFFHRSAIEKIGSLDTDLHYLMDRDWWLKYLFIYGLNNIVQIPDTIVNFRLHPNSKTLSQRDQFQVEHDSWYLALAEQAGLATLAHAIRENLEVKEGYRIKNLPSQPKELVEEVLNYYLLLRANELYVAQDNKRVATLLSHIDRTKLQEKDQKLWKKIFFRNRYVPRSIIRLFRKEGPA